MIWRGALRAAADAAAWWRGATRTAAPVRAYSLPVSPRHDKLRRQRKARHFVDKLIVEVQAGHGGDGCVSFHREKFVEKGPAAGGNGGHGGSVYIRSDASMHSLARVPKRISAAHGSHGEGDWLHGRKGADVTLRVPVGTTVRSLGWTNNPRSALAQPYIDWLAQPRSRRVDIDLDDTPELAASRAAVWRHFPRFEEDNYEREHFAAAEDKLMRELKAIQSTYARLPHEQQSAAARSEPTELEPHQVEDLACDAGWSVDLDAPTPPSSRGWLLARGGQGGLGNPHFLLERYHAPKIATKGLPGESLLLSLEYKQPCDVGLVGMPNAGKSTLLRSLSRANAEVGDYSFTTLYPNLGVMRVGTDGHLLQADAPEAARMVVADLPGLVRDASANRGLGHDFLRHIERCERLVYVVDFGPSNPRPSSDIVLLNRELDAYLPGLIERVVLVVANKADLLGTDEPGMPTVEDARDKLAKLRGDTQLIFEPRTVPVIPVSAKHHLNVDLLVKTLHQGGRPTL